MDEAVFQGYRIHLSIMLTGVPQYSLKGCQRNVEVWQRILKVRGLVVSPEEDLTMWVSDDMNRVPVRLQAEVLVGSIKMDLKSFSGLAHPLALEK